MNNSCFIKSISILENGFRGGNLTVKLPSSDLVVALLSLLYRLGLISGWQKTSPYQLLVFLRYLPGFNRYPLFLLKSTGTRSIFLDRGAVSRHPSPYLVLSTSSGLKTSHEAAVAGLGGLVLLEINLF